MTADYVQPMIHATRHVFRHAVGLDLVVGSPSLVKNHAPRHLITGVMRLEGENPCVMALSLDRTLALAVTSHLRQERVPELNEEVADTVGELINMVAGCGRTLLTQLNLSLGLPEVIRGRSRSIQFPAGAKVTTIPVIAKWGELSIDYGVHPSIAKATSIRL